MYFHKSQTSVIFNIFYSRVNHSDRILWNMARTYYLWRHVWWWSWYP